MQDSFTAMLVSEQMGYMAAKKLNDGTYIAMLRLFSTVAICTGVNSIGFTNRFCYADLNECQSQFDNINSMDDVPTGWIAARPEDPDVREKSRLLEIKRIKTLRDKGLDIHFSQYL